MRCIDKINFFNNFYIGSYLYFSHMIVKDKTKLTHQFLCLFQSLWFTFIFTYIQGTTLIDRTKLFVNINNWGFNRKFDRGNIFIYFYVTISVIFIPQYCYFAAYGFIYIYIYSFSSSLFLCPNPFPVLCINCFSCFHHVATQDPGQGTKFCDTSFFFIY